MKNDLLAFVIFGFLAAFTWHGYDTIMRRYA